MAHRTNVSNEEKLRLLFLEKSRLHGDLAGIEKLISELYKRMGEASTKSQPPTAPGNPPKKDGD